MIKKLLLGLVAVVVLAGAAFGVVVATATNVRQLREAATLTPNGKAERTRAPNALDYSVAINVAADPEKVWSLLTDVAGYARWNSTISSIEGSMSKGGHIRLVAKVAPDHPFDLAVSEFDAPSRMIWEEGGKVFLGVRTFTLTASPGGGSTLAMQETFSGAMLGVIEKKLPDLRSHFEGFVGDLKRVAEAKAAAGP